MSLNEKVSDYDQYMRVKVTLNPASNDNNETQDQQQQGEESSSAIDGVIAKKKRKRGKAYIEDPRKRSKSRSQRKNGLLQAMGTLKLVSGDDTYLEITNANSQEVSVFSTSQQILLEKEHFRPIPSELSPSAAAPTQVETRLAPPSPQDNELFLSTSDKQKLEYRKGSFKHTVLDQVSIMNPDQCQICKRSCSLDTDLMSPWLKCHHKGCFYWCHMLCLGIVATHEEAKDFKFRYFCPSHVRKYKVLSETDN